MGNICKYIKFNMNIIFLISIGALIGILNSLAIKWTIKKTIEYKNIKLVIFSFFIRMTIICILFYYFMNNNWKNAIFMLLGLTISKILFIILNRTKSIKK